MSTIPYEESSPKLVSSEKFRTGRFTIRKKGSTLLPRHYMGLDPSLTGLNAFNHPAVIEWWEWLLKDYKPASSLALITPCSNVKPYNKSPASRKIRGILKRLGLWDSNRDKPLSIAWLYFSDLLILVPYERVEEYPACCYDVPPDIVLENTATRDKVVKLLATIMHALVEKGLEKTIVYLPRKHLELWSEASRLATRWPVEKRVKYSVFSVKSLEEAIKSLG